MKFRLKTISVATLSAISLATTTALLADQASAQSAPSADKPVAASPATNTQQDTAEEKDKKAKSDSKVESIEKVTVTGSRILRAGFDTLEPATVVSRKTIENLGITNIAEALRIPGFGVGITPEGNQSGFGVAVNFVNRFSLGSARTLTLINGRRVVASNSPTIFGPAGPGLQVDLNLVPTQLVDRIENLAIGGAPTYGADAIAGVVNIITRRDYEGFETNATFGQTDHADGQRQNVGFLWGKNFGDKRANVTLSYVYDQADGVLQTARDRFKSNFAFLPNPCLNGASSIVTSQPGRTPGNDGRVNTGTPFQTCLPTAATDGIPNSVLIQNNRFFTFTGGGVLLPATGASNLADGRLRGFGTAQTTYLYFDANRNLVPYNPGTNFGVQNAVGGDGFNLTETAQITSDLKRHTFNMLGSYRVTNNAELFYEGLFYNAKGFELADQSIYNANLFGGLSAPLTFASTYPLLSTASRATLAANGITSFRLSRASRDLVNNNANSETDVRRSVIGAKGNFEIGTRSFNWEISANQGVNNSKFFATVLNQQNFINALNVTNSGSSVVCSVTPTPGLIIPGGGAPIADPRCVPLNLFGEGAPSAEARSYVTSRTTTRSKIEQEVYNANVGGSPFDTWGGPVSVNVGLERRVEKGGFFPDDFQRAGLGRAVAINGNEGSYRTKEVFGEFVIPLADDAKKMLFLNGLDITGKFRRVDSSVNGKADTYTYGFQWRPIRDVEIRGNITRALRSPAITELFTPVSNIFTTVPDPCDSRNVNSGTRPLIRAVNCAAFYRQFNLNGSTFLSTAVNATIPGTLSGDPKLANENSDGRNIGIVFQPRVVKGLRMAVDYYTIEVKNVIANLNATATAEGCYDNPDTANSFCRRIVRDAAGQITGITTGYVNGGFLNFTGVAADVQYQANLTDWGIEYGGQASLAVTASRLRRLENSTNKITTTKTYGEIGNSPNQVQVAAEYTKNDVSFNLQGSYIGPAVFLNTNSAEQTDQLRVSSYWLWSGGASYNFSKNLTGTVAVTNLFDEQPPFPLAGAAIGVYDILGRRYSVSLRYKF
jgi:outer membrane receptor protein involved in Fe transport